MSENYELRHRASDQLGGSIFKRTWLMLTVICFIANLIVSAASGLFAVAGVIITGAIEYGTCRITNNIILGKKPSLDDMFIGFDECFGNTLALFFFRNMFIFFWSLLLVFPGIIKSYSYAMSTYIQQRSENKSWQYSMDESKRLMDGYKGQLFRLDLSFIGWYILGACCLGIGILFVIPYHTMARTEFFEARLALDGESQPDNAN